MKFVKVGLEGDSRRLVNVLKVKKFGELYEGVEFDENDPILNTQSVIQNYPNLGNFYVRDLSC